MGQQSGQLFTAKRLGIIPMRYDRNDLMKSSIHRFFTFNHGEVEIVHAKDTGDVRSKPQ